MRDVDRIIDLVRCELPGAEVQQLQVKHPEADDDGLWFFWFPGVSKGIQIESSTGTCPFVIEHDDMNRDSQRGTRRFRRNHSEGDC